MSEVKSVRGRKNAEETRLALLSSFAKLHEDKPYQDITITAICKKAGVANSTFYYYFDSVDQMVSQRFEKLVTELDKACEEKEMVEAIRLGVECAQREKEIFLLMASYSTDTHEQIYTRCVLPFILKYVDVKDTPQVFNECVTTCLVCATVGLLYNWLKKDRPYTVKQVTRVIAEMIETANSQCEIRKTINKLI